MDSKLIPLDTVQHISEKSLNMWEGRLLQSWDCLKDAPEIELKHIFCSKSGSEITEIVKVNLVTFGKERELRLATRHTKILQDDKKTVKKGRWFLGENQLMFSEPIRLGTVSFSGTPEYFMLKITLCKEQGTARIIS